METIKGSTKIGVSTLPFLTMPIDKAVEFIISLDVTIIELFMDVPYAHPYNLNKKIINNLNKLKDMYNISYFIHPPCYDLNPATLNKSLQKEIITQYVYSIKLAEELEARGMVVHSGHLSLPEANREEVINSSINFIKNLTEEAYKRGVKLLIENTGYGINSLFKNHLDFFEYLKRLETDHPIYSVLDVGHAYLQGFDLIEAVKSLKKMIAHVHLHDNKGIADEHLPLGKGVIPLVPFIKTLKKEVNPATTMIIEIAPNPVEKVLKNLKNSIRFVKDI